MRNFYPTKLILPTLALGFSLTMGTSLYAACVPDDCASLGYTKSASECAGMETIKCPFDDSKLYCPQPLVICTEEDSEFCKEKFTCSPICSGYEKTMKYEAEINYRTNQICKPAYADVNIDTTKEKWVIRWCIDECKDELKFSCKKEPLPEKSTEIDMTTSEQNKSEGWT